MAARKTEDPEVEEEGQEEELEDEEADQGGTSINITEDAISIEITRDGNEAATLSGIASLVEGLSQ